MSSSESNNHIATGEDGQAVFELIIFMPLLLLVLTLMVTTSNAINASINQQKVTRGYFYYLLRGNSLGQNTIDLAEYGGQSNMSNVGMSVVGWRRNDPGHSTNDTYAVCYRFSTLFSSESSDQECDNPTVTASSTPFIRVYTAYGLCTETFTLSNQLGGLSVNHQGRSAIANCSLRQ